ncbi:Oxidation resistance protein 1 [Linum perenne]
MGKQRSLRSKAVHFVSDLTTVLLNPISDKPPSNPSPQHPLSVVGDRKGAVFGGLVEAPLRPTTKKYQGTNTTFVFTNTSGSPVIFRPTGANRYFTLCSTDFLAVGGGGHFALYLDNDLLNGSSAVSETYGNPCLAFSEDFEIKEVELWGFVYGSKYDELLASSRREAPGICRW